MRETLLIAFIFVTAVGIGASECVTTIKDVPFTEQPTPTALRSFIPRGALVRLVLPLSSTDTLLIYEAGPRTDPDGRLLVVRGETAVFRYPVKKLGGSDPEWGLSLTAMKAAHLCSGDENITFLVFQTGNSGGYFAALRERSHFYRLIPIRSVQQGKLVLHVNSPARISVWDVADEDRTLCTGCRKHYIVRTMELRADAFATVEQATTRTVYASFQDSPLEVLP